MPDMLVMVPTRGRPANCKRFAEAYAATVRGDTDLLWITDEDDEPGEATKTTGRNLLLPRGNLVQKLNIAAGKEAGRYPVLMFAGDDLVPLTEGWDKLLLAAIDGMGGTGYSYPQDNSRQDIPEHVCISSDIVRTLGWFAEPSLKHFYIDNVWADLGNAVDRIKFVGEAVLDHLHANRGLAPVDATYQTASTYYPGDYARYLAWRAERFEADVATIRALL